ncbi:hypothetical protein B0H67DRAFT_558795 [Lasiosphaeris hirsuta]|uniref:Uncharacterized protein n=1 Tax=Lasiosphaeris hirsuta TaxID=260670 RepID=A0AA39ZPT7_9PEZI|nr:hypothetical protein B0H67DRAFT_558795 [Lasiosphaeris hirsuta]
MEKRTNYAPDEGNAGAPPPNRHNEPDEPEAVSINQILRRHSRDRLFVHPLHWTSQQVVLLECHFAQKTVKVPPALHAQFPEPLHFAADRLWQACLAKKRILHDLLEDYNLQRHHSSSLPFRFGRQEVTRVATHGVFSPASSTSSAAPPKLACLELAAVQERRNDSVLRRPGNDVIAVNLQLKHQHRLRPANKVEDPYIVATLVALAQEQHLQDPTRPACELLYPGDFLLDCITPLTNIPSLPSSSSISASPLNQQQRCYL